MGYRDGLTLQERMVRLRRARQIPDTLLLLEHGHVVTRGSSAKDEHILLSEEERERRGIEVFEAGRGGDVTYHGPGQIVGYPILWLEGTRRDAHRYLRDLEEVILRALGDLGLPASRRPRYTGVWVNGEKIAAIGVRLTRWITSHGFALNVDPDLTYFDTIVPCGIADRGVTSIHEQGLQVTMKDVEDLLVQRFGEVFGRRMHPSSP